MGGQAVIYRARKVYRGDGALLDNAAVLCREGRIASVAPWREMKGTAAETVELGDVLLLPGLVNAHTHLRLTHLKGRIAPARDFVAWLGKIALRSKFSRRATLQRAILAGAQELLEGGVTTAVEIDVDGLSAQTLPAPSHPAIRNPKSACPLRLTFAHECISFDPAEAEKVASRLMNKIAELETVPLCREHGIAPHAPYSVSRELWEKLAGMVEVRQVGNLSYLLTVHVAESAEEMEMFQQGRGKLVRWLRVFGVLPRDWRAPHCSPVAFLEKTGILATRGIAVHCGFVTDDDAQRLARYGWTVAFCPGTHEYFDRPPYPLERLRHAGVPVCVATDSAASNTGLSVMEEMRRLARRFPNLSAAEIVAAATTIPAQAIGWAEDVGRIEVGYCADLSAWSPCCEGDRLGRSWFENEPPVCVATIIGGQIVWQRIA